MNHCFYGGQIVKKIVDSKELSDVIIPSMNKIASIVKATLGPGGRTILIERVGQALDGTPLGPRITKDGVSVAEECASPIKEEDVIIQSVKSICKKTNSDAGDGTTTAIVLGEAILQEMCNELTFDTKLNPQLVKESVELASKEVIDELKSQSIKVENYDIIKEVATISANGDEEIGSIISEAFRKVGAEGMVTVDEGYTSKVTLDVVDGYQFNRGAESRDNFFNNASKTQFEASDVAILIYDGSLQNFTQLIPALMILSGVDPNDPEKRPTRKIPPILVIANDFTSEVVNFMLLQKQQIGTVICPVRGPHATHVRTGYYDDLAAYTGATRLGNGNRSITAIEGSDFGMIERVVVDKYKTTLYNGVGEESSILERVEQLKAQKNKAETPYDAQVLSERIAALTNGVAKIGVGGVTEFEIKEKYDRIEDALNASRAAIQEGVVPGGGCTLLRISNRIDPDKSVGHKILKKALIAPFLQILTNIGLNENDVPYDTILNTENLVYDARHRKVVNALSSGVIDPVKVTRCALENAVSIASLLSTAGGAIIYKKD